MGVIRLTSRPRTARGRVAVLGALFLMAFCAQLLLAGPAAAAPYTGGFSPTIFNGMADLNGDNQVSGRDDSNAFYGDTHIIDGLLDCDAWTAPNEGALGDGTIDASDDCTLIGYDGTVDGVTIDVVAGVFDWPDGPLPTVFNATDPDNPDVGDSDFAWSAINGRVDSDGNEAINAGDCHFGLVGTTTDVGLGDATDGYDILGNTQANSNPCGFANAPAAANNGLVDRNSDGNITSADSCSDGCFFRHNVSFGVVQAAIGSPYPASPAGAFTGGFSPTIVSGRADLNGNGVVNGADDATAFYGDTDIIDGFLDCNAWSGANDGAAGDGVINSADSCTLVGYDGTANGVTIDVIDGEFQVANGPLPTVFNAGDPDNPDVGDSDFAWSAIRGRVDSNGNEFIDPEDCHFGIVGQADILGSSATCGFAITPAFANNGLVDLNSDGVITAADSCSNGCFFRHDVRNGFVMKLECPGFEGDPRNDVVGSLGPDTLVGTAGADIICGFGGNDILRGRGGNDLLLGGGGADILSGRSGADILRGGTGADVLRGGGRADVLRGGGGNDRLFGNRGNDRLYGNRGNDRLDGGAGIDRGIGGPGRDTFIRCEFRQQ
jgi:Ca2+-binding RTX toxin-like protein